MATMPPVLRSIAISAAAWITDRIKSVARKHSKGRIVSSLEGGYNLGALARSVAAHLRVLAGV